MDDLKSKAAEQGKVLANKQAEADESLKQITTTMQVWSWQVFFLDLLIFLACQMCIYYFNPFMIWSYQRTANWKKEKQQQQPCRYGVALLDSNIFTV